MKTKLLLILILSATLFSCSEDCEDKKDRIKEYYAEALEATDNAKKTELLLNELQYKLANACD